MEYDLPATFDLSGSTCQIRQLDVDFDQQPDVVVSFAAGRGSDGWIFKWNGSELTSVTPTEFTGGRQVSRLFSPVFYDFTHSGWLQVVSPGDTELLEDDQPVRAPDSVYSSSGALYQLSGFVLTVAHFTVGSDQRLKVSHFRKSVDSQGPYVVRVINGDRTGNNRIASGSISLNGVVVVTFSQLTSTTEFVEVMIPDLPIENTLVAVLEGGPDAAILVRVSDSTQRQ